MEVATEEAIGRANRFRRSSIAWAWSVGAMAVREMVVLVAAAPVVAAALEAEGERVGRRRLDSGREAAEETVEVRAERVAGGSGKEDEA